MSGIKRHTAWLTFAAIFLLALGVRLVSLDARPMHTDEAVHGIILGRLLEGNGYRYDPAEYHGPTLYYLTAPLALLRGQSTTAALTETTLRLLPALCGAAMILLFALWRNVLGSPAVTWAAIFTAIAPIQLYYSRYFIQEPLLALFGLAFITFAVRYLFAPHAGWALAAGISAGLMHATKQTSVLMFAAMAGALIILKLFTKDDEASTARPQISHIALALLAAVLTSAAFYSSFFTHPAGIADSLTSLFHFVDRAAGQGHEKAWFTHLQWIGWTRSGGFTWTEGFLVLLAIAAVVRSSNDWNFLNPGFPMIGTFPPRLIIIFLALYVILLIGIYSAIPYKTPWLMLAPMLIVCLLAGTGVAALIAIARSRLSRTAIIIVLFAGTVHLARQSSLAAFRYASDERVPYAYAHTSPDAVRLSDELIRAAGLLDASEQTIFVAAREYWPLPWCLRSIEHVGYWNDLPDQPAAPLMVLDPDYSAALELSLAETHTPRIAGLRPGVMVVAWFRKDLWEIISNK